MVRCSRWRCLPDPRRLDHGHPIPPERSIVFRKVILIEIKNIDRPLNPCPNAVTKHQVEQLVAVDEDELDVGAAQDELLSIRVV